MGEDTCTYIATSTSRGRAPRNTQQTFQEVQHLFPVAITPCEKLQACMRREVLKHRVHLTRVVSYCLCNGLGLARRNPAGRPKPGFQSRQVHGSQSPSQNMLLQDGRRQGSIPPRIAHASGYVSCCKIAAEISALTSP
jgi:hypothetical protein